MVEAIGFTFDEARELVAHLVGPAFLDADAGSHLPGPWPLAVRACTIGPVTSSLDEARLGFDQLAPREHRVAVSQPRISGIVQSEDVVEYATSERGVAAVHCMECSCHHVARAFLGRGFQRVTRSAPDGLAIEAIPRQQVVDQVEQVAGEEAEPENSRYAPGEHLGSHGQKGCGEQEGGVGGRACGRDGPVLLSVEM